MTLARCEIPSSLRKSPRAFAVFPWGQKSLRSRVSLIFSEAAQAFFEGTVSTLRPSATVPSLAKARRFFSSDFIWREQIPVQARGCQERRTFFPRREESRTCF